MPVEFDPQWEYFVPNEEIEEIFIQSRKGLSSFDYVATYDDTGDNGSNISGMRVGSPDFSRTYQREMVFTPSKSRPGRRCKRCEKLFFPETDKQRFCDGICRADHHEAIKASGRYRIRTPEQKAKAKEQERERRLNLTAEKMESMKIRFFAMMNSGETLFQIADRLDINVATVVRWRSYYGMNGRIKKREKPVEKNCKRCGVLFVAQAYRNQSCCSVKCGAKFGGRKKTAIEVVDCPGCGKKMTIDRQHLRKYCSMECSRLYKFKR